MIDKPVFIDTNLLVYAYSEAADETRKKKVCFSLLEHCFLGNLKLVISNQILSEFAHVTSKKIQHPLPLQKIRNIIHWITLFQGFIKLNYSTKTVEMALQFVQQYHLSYWDALIIATMFEYRIFTIYTENEKDFAKVPGLTVINPLK